MKESRGKAVPAQPGQALRVPVAWGSYILNWWHYSVPFCFLKWRLMTSPCYLCVCMCVCVCLWWVCVCACGECVFVWWECVFFVVSVCVYVWWVCVCSVSVCVCVCVCVSARVLDLQTLNQFWRNNVWLSRHWILRHWISRHLTYFLI
jgi:hypothetical protein